MHASIWRLAGDPDELAARYDSLLAELGSERMELHLCLRAPDGLVVVDTCPTEAAFREFASSADFAAALQRHGLPPLSNVEDHAVHVAVAGGRVVAGPKIARADGGAMAGGG
jgi:hypothetical protein